ncbi:MAG TPA: hypothetical protein PKY96_04385, partial [Flavobacteriales bacterium]|nr:hypothetical protein [Flavobacteriales bacterium]
MSTASEIARFLELRSGGPPSLDEAIRWRSAGGSAETEALLRAHASRPDTKGSAAPLLVQWLGWQGRIEEAYRVLEHWLLENGAFTLTHLTTRLSSILGIPAEPIEARYVLHRDAMQSLGAWHHVTTASGPEQHILTKIIHEAHAGNEPLFYHRIRPIHSDLHGITPRLIDIFHLPGMPVILLSMTMVPGTPCDTSQLSSEQQKNIALACRMICDTPLGALRSILPDGEQRFGYSHGYLVSALSNIHLASNWARIDEWIRTALVDRDYPERIAT